MGAAVAFGAFSLGCSSSNGGSPPAQDAGVPPGDGSIGSDAPAPPVDGAVGPAPGTTGAACTAPTDCQGTSPQCRTKTMNGLPYPGGYCTSSCTIAKNDASTGENPDCPGTGTCLGTGTTGICLALCTAKTGLLPCRDGYSCFSATDVSSVCLPTAASECDPTLKGSCPKDDAGAARTCVPIGPDPVGECDPACDVFAQDCPAAALPDGGAGAPQNCYANQFGEGLCATQAKSPSPDGTACAYVNDCDKGLACHVEGMAGVCRPYCGGSGNVMCSNGKQCVDLNMTVPKTTVGICGG